MKLWARCATVTACLALAGPFGRAQAHAEKAKASAPAKNAELDRLKQTLESGNEADRLSALDALGSMTGSSVAPAAGAVNEFLARGANVSVLVRALEVAGKLAQPSSSAAVAPYARHRTPEIRAAATHALGATGGPDAVAALRAILHGDDAPSRGLAASGLATLKAKDAVPDLFAVLAKDVPEAAAAIGELCGPADCTKFADFIGKLPFDLMQSGLSPILLRPESEVPPELKLDLLEQLRKLQTDEARKFLRTVRSSYPSKGNAWVKYALDQAVENKPVLPPGGAKGKSKP
jgi:HEAT repeat protein